MEARTFGGGGRPLLALLIPARIRTISASAQKATPSP